MMTRQGRCIHRGLVIGLTVGLGGALILGLLAGLLLARRRRISDRLRFSASGQWDERPNAYSQRTEDDRTHRIPRLGNDEVLLGLAPGLSTQGNRNAAFVGETAQQTRGSVNFADKQDAVDLQPNLLDVDTKADYFAWRSQGYSRNYIPDDQVKHTVSESVG